MALVALVALVACGTARRSEPLAGALALEDPVLVQGEQTFARYCQQCHPQGEAGLGPSLNDKPLPGWLIRFQVRNGMGVMPRFTRAEISEAELDALLQYMRSLRARTPQLSPG